MSDLEVILPQSTTIEIGGESITVSKFKFGQLPKAMKVVKSIMGPAIDVYTKGKQPDFETALEVFADSGQDVIDFMAECIGKPSSFIENLDPDEGITLVKTFFEVNADFFMQKVLPMLMEGQKIKKQKVGQK